MRTIISLPPLFKEYNTHVYLEIGATTGGAIIPPERGCINFIDWHKDLAAQIVARVDTYLSSPSITPR